VKCEAGEVLCHHAPATKSRSTRKSTVKADDAVKAAAKRITVKQTAKPAAKKTAAKPAKPATKAPAKRNEREQDSVTATMIRGKRDWKTRKIDTKWMPAKDGGVRFEEEQDNGRSPLFVTQEDFAAMGEPKKVRVTVKALA